MKKPARLCSLCRERPADLPDRNRPGAIKIRMICGECHAAQLREDLRRIAALHRGIE